MHFWFLGDTSRANPRYLARLRELAAPLGDRAWWSGNLSLEDVSRHLQAVDIFLLPQADGHLTRSGSFLAAVEHGLPVVAIRNAVNQAEFTHGKDVWLLDGSSAADLAAAVRTLAADTGLRAKLGANAKQIYMEVFDWNQTQPAAQPGRERRTVSMPASEALPRASGQQR